MRIVDSASLPTAPFHCFLLTRDVAVAETISPSIRTLTAIGAGAWEHPGCAKRPRHKALDAASSCPEIQSRTRRQKFLGQSQLGSTADDASYLATIRPRQ